MKLPCNTLSSCRYEKVVGILTAKQTYQKLNSSIGIYTNSLTTSFLEKFQILSRNRVFYSRNTRIMFCNRFTGC